MNPEQGPRGSGLRRRLSLLLVLLAAPAALAGGVLLYAREEIVDTSAFTDRAVASIRQAAVSRVVAREIAVQVVEPGLPDLVAARPLIEDGLARLIEAESLRPVLRLAAEHGHRLLFEASGGNAVFDIADAGAVVSSALRTLAPNLAKRLPRNTDAVLLTLRRRSFAATTLRFADTVRVLGLVLPTIAVLLLAAAIGIAPDRRRAITAGAVALGLSGILLVVALVLARRYTVTHVYGIDELTNADVRGAVGVVWDSFLHDLMTSVLVATALAWLLAAASAAILGPYSAATGIGRIRDLARRPLSPRARAARGTVVLIVGVIAMLRPTLVLRVLVIVAGTLLVYIAAGELLSVTAPATPRVRRERAHLKRRLAAAGVLATAAVAGIAVATILTGGATSVRASTGTTCNGYAQLCNRRLDQVVFAGTHNSMSAADSPGWLIANQDRDVAQQLNDGIRLFKISTHYATRDSGGGVHTDIGAEGTRLNRVASKLDPGARAALQRLSAALGRGSLSAAKRDIWLCHTLCELGATRMVDFLQEIRRFLESEPHQVLILFDEDYVSESDLQKAFVRAKLFNRLAVLHRNQPLPTLGDLIRTRRNIIVFAQKSPSGRFAWNTNAFGSWIQDTPLGATKPAQFSCEPARGSAGDPLLMMNDWADIFPPRPQPNVPLVKREFILARARQCVQQRGRIPNLILTDYYNRGDVVGAAATLNGVTGPPSAG